MKAMPKLFRYGAVVVALGAIVLLCVHLMAEGTPQPATGVVQVAAAPAAAVAQPIAVAAPAALPPTLASALKLDAGARLREPLPAGWQQGIVCGEVSPDGDPANFSRFVYNGSGGRGAIDDGTELFRKFADKICLMQPKP